MKTRIPLLIAAGLFLSTISKAQFAPACNDSRVVFQAGVSVGFPPSPVYHDNRNWNREDDNRDYYDNRGYYDNRKAEYRDKHHWKKMDEYERFCYDHPAYRVSRHDFYRNRDFHYRRCAEPRAVVVYRY